MKESSIILWAWLTFFVICAWVSTLAGMRYVLVEWGLCGTFLITGVYLYTVFKEGKEEDKYILEERRHQEMLEALRKEGRLP